MDEKYHNKPYKNRKRRKRRNQYGNAYYTWNKGGKRKLRRILYHVQNRLCYWCGMAIDMNSKQHTPDEPTLDHVVPLSEGGDAGPNNIVLAHARCNQERTKPIKRC